MTTTKVKKLKKIPEPVSRGSGPDWSYDSPPRKIRDILHENLERVRHENRVREQELGTQRDNDENTETYGSEVGC